MTRDDQAFFDTETQIQERLVCTDGCSEFIISVYWDATDTPITPAIELKGTNFDGAGDALVPIVADSVAGDLTISGGTVNLAAQATGKGLIVIKTLPKFLKVTLNPGLGPEDTGSVFKAAAFWR